MRPVLRMMGRAEKELLRVRDGKSSSYFLQRRTSFATRRNGNDAHEHDDSYATYNRESSQPRITRTYTRLRHEPWFFCPSAYLSVRPALLSRTTVHTNVTCPRGAWRCFGKRRTDTQRSQPGLGTSSKSTPGGFRLESGRPNEAHGRRCTFRRVRWRRAVCFPVELRSPPIREAYDSRFDAPDPWRSYCDRYLPILD